MAAASRERDSFVLKYLLTISAATVAETVTFPLDIVKTRLQVSRQLSGQPRDGAIRTTVSLVKREGFLQLWAGLRPAVLRHWVYSGCRMTFYEVIRDHVFMRDRHGRYPLWKALPSGMLAGAGGQFLASPMDRVKIILQVKGTNSLSSSSSSSSPSPRGTWRTLREIVGREGVRGLWKGWVPNCQRAALVCLGDLTTYDTVKQSILRNTTLRDNALTHSLSSFASGLVAATLGTPADVVKSRMMSQQYHLGNEGGTLYKSSLDCLTSTVKQEGFWALYKGFIPIWSRMAPWSLTFWLVYEEVRVLAGIGNF